MCVSWAITLVIPKPGPDGAAPNLLTEHELTWYSKNRVWLAFASAWQVCMVSGFSWQRCHVSTPVRQRLQVTQKDGGACPEKFLLSSVV